MDPQPVINVIHDPARAERYEPLMRQLAGLQHRVWPAVHADTFATGCANAHKAVVRSFREAGLPFGCVAEDDLQWCGDPAGAWHHFLAGMLALPPDWDVYLAGISAGAVDRTSTAVVRRVTRHTGHHLYMVSRRCYDRVLACPAGQHLDVWLGRQKVSAYTCWPLAATQAPGFSANRGRVVDYHAAFSRYALREGTCR